MTAVAAAINKSADALETVKETVNGIYRDADDWGFSIDTTTGTVTPTDESRQDQTLYQQQQAELVARITEVLTQANTADADLAHAITTTGGAGEQITQQSGGPESLLSGSEVLADLQRANDKSVLAAIERVQAAQAAYDKAAAAAYTHGPGSPEAEAALAQLPGLKQELASSLDALGQIPDYTGIDPNSLTVGPDGNLMFSYPLNGQMVDVTGTLKNGTGQIFDQGKLAYFTYQNGQLVGTRFLDQGRAIASAEPLLTAVTTAVGAGPMIKSGQAGWAGLRALFGAESVNAIPETVLARGAELAAIRAESATSHLAALGPGTWTPVTESMSARAAAYQMQITGHPIAEGYVVQAATGPVKFDAFDQGVLTEVKSYYSQFIENGAWKPFFSGQDAMIDQAVRQVAAAGGTPVQWVFAERQTMAVVQQMLDDAGVSGIRFVVVPPA